MNGILTLRWDHVDFRRGCITVENAKNDEIREVAMSASLTGALRSVNVHAKGAHVFNREGEGAREVSSAGVAELEDARDLSWRAPYWTKVSMMGLPHRSEARSLSQYLCIEKGDHQDQGREAQSSEDQKDRNLQQFFPP
jgi:hypothetical protein